jgi:hypothetical protein
VPPIRKKLPEFHAVPPGGGLPPTRERVVFVVEVTDHKDMVLAVSKRPVMGTRLGPLKACPNIGKFSMELLLTEKGRDIVQVPEPGTVSLAKFTHR